MKFAVVTTALALAMSGSAIGQSDMKGMDMKTDQGAKKSQSNSHHADGTVKSVDAAQGTVTVAHQPVASLNWPAMTMKFKAKDKKMLDAVKPGAKIEFDFEQHGKDYVITKLK